MKNKEACFTSNSDEYSTPQWLFDELNEEFNFTIDVAASKENAKCEKYYTKEDDGLSKIWHHDRVFCNPPYSKWQEWIEKAYFSKPELAVFLLPARTDTRAFHGFIWDDFTNKPKSWAEVRFIKGRLKFNNSKNSAPFPSMIVIFRR